MIIVMGSARALPDARDELISAAATMAAATRPDDGCESYGFFIDVSDLDVVASMEVWRDQAALDAHMLHAHTTSFLDLVGSLIEGEPQMSFYVVSDS